MPKLMEATVRDAQEPGLLWDSDTDPEKAKTCVSGFGLRVHPSGTKSFFLNYRLLGVQRRKTIGTHPTWTVAAAREEAKELRKRVDRDEDPAVEARERREAPEVKDLIARYIAEHLPKKRAAQRDTKVARQRVADEKKMLEEIGKHLGKHTKVADVHIGDVEAMHRKISESIGRGGKPRAVRANRILAIASKMFSLALKPMAGENKPWRDQAQGNPCKGVQRNDEGDGRERYYSEAELAAIADALAQYPGVAADCLRLIMLTGCRPIEAKEATWGQFDAEPGFWIKPSAHTKQKKVHKLPLNPPAIELLERLRAKRAGTVVFPGDVTGEPLATIWHAWDFVKKQAKLAPDEEGNEPRPYDLRHTFASVTAGANFGLPIIGKLLGHTQARTTQRYAHLADDPVRQATEKAGTVISRAGQARAEVVNLKG
jgi:integrase